MEKQEGWERDSWPFLEDMFRHSPPAGHNPHPSACKVSSPAPETPGFGAQTRVQKPVTEAKSGTDETPREGSSSPARVLRAL